VRLLVLDHFFSQDIEGIEYALGPDDELRVLDYDILRSESLRVFSEDVADGIINFTKPEYEPQREEWARRLRAILEEEFMRAPYDAFLVPSDMFFYIRAAPEICHDLGVPFLGVQKETTISDLVMDSADEAREYAPPIVDYTTVCGERLNEFWIRMGGDPATSTVIGQPRFDFYRHPDRWPASLGYGEGGPVALFFSYHVDQHHPSQHDPSTAPPVPVWAALHEQTERELWELARRGWRVLVKPHPQQPWQAERRRIREQVGDLLEDRVFLVDPLADARKLIAGSDVIVGFQTTAMIESMLARKPVVYTFWDDEAKSISSHLIPFAEWPDLIHVVERQEDLVPTVEAVLGATYDSAQAAKADEIVERYLGRIDGDASERTVEWIRDKVAEWESRRSPEVEARRRELASRRPPLRLARRTRRGYKRLRHSVGAALGR
jgi:hypothetical protein